MLLQALSLEHHFITIGEFKLELQSRNATPNLVKICFFPRVTLKFDGWLWKTIGHLFYATSSVVHHFITIGEFKLELQSENAKICYFLCVTLKFDRWSWKTVGSLLCYSKLCASLYNHQKIHTRLTMRKGQIWVKLAIFSPVWPWNLMDDLEKPIGHIFYATSSFVHHSMAIRFWPLWPWPLTSHIEALRWWEPSEKGVTGRRTEPFIL